MDFDEGLKHVADELVYINSPDTTVHGPEGVRQVLEPFFAPIQENEFIIQRKIAESNRVVLERLDRHRIPEGWFELPVAGVYEVQEGKKASIEINLPAHAGPMDCPDNDF